MQWNLLSPLEQRHWEHKYQDYARKRNCVAVPEQPLQVSSAQSFNLETQQCLWTDEPVASWQPWLLLGFVSAGGSEPRKSPASEAVLALPLYSWSQMTLQCVLFPGTYAFLFFPWRPSLGRPEVPSHQVPTSVLVLNARGANTLTCAGYAGYVHLVRTARFQGWFSKGRQTFSI